MNSKNCSVCKNVQPYENFHKNGSGLRGACKTCTKQIDHKRKDRRAETRAIWVENNRERDRANQRRYHALHPEINENIKKRKENDALYKLTAQTRSLVSHSFKRYRFTKNSKTAELLKCSFEELQEHLVNSALRNYGFYLYDEPYHIDHIIPLSSASTEEDLVNLWHFSNLQFLTPHDNISKSNKVS